MAKSGGSLPRGRRLREETPPVPARESLSADDAEAQRVLKDLVEKAGGRFGGSAVPVGHLGVLAELFERWARANSDATPEGGVYFSGQPGLWKALDQLYPLQDPNRWDRLRGAVIADLEKHGWRRRRPPRGAGFDLP